MGLYISRIFHAGYQFECGEAKILFDPLFESPFSQNCYAFPDVKFDVEQIRQSSFSAIFISHYHDDHCSFESLDLLNRNIPIYIYCVFEDLILMIQKLGFKNVISLTLDQSIFIGPFEIIPRRALNEDVDCLFHIKAEGKNILNVVDSWIGEETFRQLLLTTSWDLLLWPFQLLQELQVLSPRRLKFEKNVSLPEEWLDQIKKLKPKVIIPSSCHFKFESWSWYNDVYFPMSYKKFEAEVKFALSDIQVVRLNPSETIFFNSKVIEKARPLKWILPQGEQNLDYSYCPEAIPATTAEIANKFNGLTDMETNRVLRYCQIEILEIYRSLEPTVEVYFDQGRLWKLSLFDQAGGVTTFYYQVKKSDIFPVESGSLTDYGFLSWSTELPIQKLFAALENGESLSSMYMRINDLVFDLEIEKEIGAVDILLDPLLRCLFSGQFGSYQRSQLVRLGYE